MPRSIGVLYSKALPGHRTLLSCALALRMAVVIAAMLLIEVQWNPAQAGSVEESGAQEPFAAPEQRPEEQRFHVAMASDHPDRWVEALARIQFIYEEDFSLREEPWIEPALRDLLTLRAAEQPARTRKIFEHEFLRTPGLGQRLLLAVIAPEDATEATTLGARLLARIAANPVRRASLFRELENAETGPLFRRLFEVLASVDPAETVLRSIELLKLRAEPDKPARPGCAADVLESVNALFGTQFADAASLCSWWSEHRDDSIVELLVDAERREKVRVWEQATLYLKQADRLLYRDWLLGSLDRTPPIPALALKDIQQFALAVRSNGLTAEQRKEMLAPVLARLLGVVRDADGKTRFADRLQGLAALGEMTDFAHHLPLLELLSEYLRPLTGPVATPAQWELGLRTIEVSGRLEAGVGAELDAILAAHRPMAASRSAVPDREELMRSILRSLLRLGPRPTTVPLLVAMAQGGMEINEGANGQDRPLRNEVRELALQVLSKWAGKLGAGERSDEDRQLLRLLFERTLVQKELSNLRTAAILGLGNLGRVDGIEPLVGVVRENLAGDRDNRVYAIRSIASIGGTAAAASLRDLRAEVAARSGDLVGIIDGEVAKLCKLDADLSLTHAYLIHADGARVPWFEEFLAMPEVARKLEPGELPSELMQRGGGAHWFAMRRALCSALEERCEAATDASAEMRGYEELHRSALAVVRFAEANAVPSVQWEEFQFVAMKSAHRAAILRALAAQSGSDAIAGMAQFFEATKEMAAASGMRPGEIFWLLRRVSSLARISGESEIVDSIRKICLADTSLALSTDAKVLLEEIAKRNEAHADSAVPAVDKVPVGPPAGQ